MRIFILATLVILSFQTFAVETVPATSARNPEVLATYSDTSEFLNGLSILKPKLQKACRFLLESQLRLQKESDSWKLFGLYEMFQELDLMTAERVRVPTVTEIAGAIPQYTNYVLIDSSDKEISELKSGSLIIADVGSQCGPDPLSVTKGAYFMRCGEFLIGSGLIALNDLEISQCLNIRVLQNSDL